MGQRSSTETVIALVQAFLDRRTWSQADLARRLSLSTVAVRKKLVELQGPFHLEREEDHPHVYWSVPKDWFPGGVFFTRAQLPELLRLLGRLPRSKARDVVLETVFRHVPRDGDSEALRGAVIPALATANEQEYLAVVEDAAARKVPLAFEYFTASRSTLTARFASVHRVVLGPPARFIATCHRAGALRWFRVESIMRARLDAAEPFRATTEAAVGTFHAASVDGFHASGAPATLTFTVREPDARWVKVNLLAPMDAEELPRGGIRVTVRTSALKQVARYVVGLGDAARAETPALVEAVSALARGALDRRA